MRQNLGNLLHSENPQKAPEHVLILAGDHLYRMDYRQMIESHLMTGADITVGAIPVSQAQAYRFGILKVSSNGQVTHFVEKPQTDTELPGLSTDASMLNHHIPNASASCFLASMGIYVFKKEVLIEKLEDESNVDFGGDVLPKSIHQNAVVAYPFEGYWEDIGTIRSFYEANLGLLETVPGFNFYDESAPIYTYRYHLPSTKVNQSSIIASMLAEGSIVNFSEITRSIIGLRSIIRAGTKIEAAIVMGADFYEGTEQIAQNVQRGIPPLGIGSGCNIRHAIIDKNARIGDEVTLVNKHGLEHADAENYCIRDSIIVVPKNAVIPSGTII